MRKYTFIAVLLFCLPLFSMGQGAFTVSITGYDAKCNGSLDGSAKATVSGGVGPYIYTWIPSVSTTDSAGGLAAGIYSVTVTDSVGDTASVSTTINQPASLNVTIDSIVVLPCFRTTGAVCGCNNTLWAIVTGGTAPYSYLWSPGGATTDTLAQACYLEFTVSVTDSNNCIATDSINVVTPTFDVLTSYTGVAQVSNTQGIIIYPNPASSQLTISIGQSVTGTNVIQVFDIMGRKVFEQQLGSNEHLFSIDVSEFANGNYLLKIVSDNTQETTHFSISR